MIFASFPFAFLFAEPSHAVNLAVAMLIIFGTAKILNEVFERLGQPGLVGEILAGILIGPSALQLVEPSEFSATLAGLGVMFLLFRVGLEVNASELVRLGGTALVVGALGVIVPFLCGWGFYVLTGHERLESIFLGTALTATSVGITAQVLAANGLLHRTASKIILGAAVVDDILALLLLGVISSVAEGSVNVSQLVITSPMAVVFIAIVARWGSHAMSGVLRFLDGNLQVGEGQFAVAMILLFGLAALSSYIGVAAIIGAFLAGLALADAAPKRVHEMTLGVTELLVPFFLVDIGLHFDVAVFRDTRVLMLAFLLIPVAVFSKILGCGIGALAFGRFVALRVGLGMVPRGEFCMVVAQTGLAMHAVSKTTYSLIVFMAICAAMIAPPLLRVAFRNVASEAEDELSASIG